MGDTLEISGEISKVDYDLRYLEIKVQMKNLRGDKVLRGVLKAGVMDA